MSKAKAKARERSLGPKECAADAAWFRKFKGDAAVTLANEAKAKERSGGDSRSMWERVILDLATECDNLKRVARHDTETINLLRTERDELRRVIAELRLAAGEIIEANLEFLQVLEVSCSVSSVQA